MERARSTSALASQEVGTTAAGMCATPCFAFELSTQQIPSRSRRPSQRGFRADDHRGIPGAPLPGAKWRPGRCATRHRAGLRAEASFDAGLFELGLTFKGGTALRKYRAGSTGRFLTDLDFAIEDPDLGEMVMETLDGAELYDVAFSVEVVTPGRRARLHVETPLGSPQIDAKLDISRPGVWLTPELREPISLPVHKGYEFEPVSLPLMTLEETLAEKLAAFRRRALVRDLYDLAWFSQGVFDSERVRRLTYLKVFIDVVEDNLGERPFNPQQDILRQRNASEFLAEDIGLLTTKVDISGWLQIIRTPRC